MYSELLWPFHQLPSSYVALDLETTGLFEGDTPPDIISVGLCRVVDCSIDSSYSYDVRPYKTYSDGSEDIHGIPWSSAQSFPELSVSWSEIVEVMQGNLVVIHNALFDWRILKLVSEEHRLRSPQINGVFCSQRASQAWAMANSIKCSERGPSLDALYESIDLKDKKSYGRHPHNAKQDSLILASITERLRKMAK